MKRLLPKSRKAEVRAERDRRIADQDPTWIDFYEFVQAEMRERGVQGSPEIFRPQLHLVLDFLDDLGVTSRGEDNENDETITHLVEFSVQHLEEGGIDALQEATIQAVASIRELSRARSLTAEGEEEFEAADDSGGRDDAAEEGEHEDEDEEMS